MVFPANLLVILDACAGGKPDIRPEWKRQRGWPCRTWVQQIEDDTGLNTNDNWRIAHHQSDEKHTLPWVGVRGETTRRHVPGCWMLIVWSTSLAYVYAHCCCNASRSSVEGGNEKQWQRTGFKGCFLLLISPTYQLLTLFTSLCSRRFAA